MSPKNHSSAAARARHRRRCLAVLAGLAVLGACSDPFKVRATYENADQAFYVHALTGAPTAFATALALPAKAVTRVDGTFAFDIAFDLTAQGEIVLLPVNVVGQNPSGGRRVGIVRPGGAYANVLEAPRTGYVYDSVTVLRKGEPAVIQAQEASCGLSLSPLLYARIVIDSVDLPTRAMYGRTTINLNCGFRSLKTGLPEF